MAGVTACLRPAGRPTEGRCVPAALVALGAVLLGLSAMGLLPFGPSSSSSLWVARPAGPSGVAAAWRLAADPPTVPRTLSAAVRPGPSQRAVPPSATANGAAPAPPSGTATAAALVGGSGLLVLWAAALARHRRQAARSGEGLISAFAATGPRAAAPPQRAARPATALAAAGDDAALPAFGAWAAARGATVGPVAVRAGGRGLATTAAVNAGETLVQVPQAVCITLQDAKAHPLVGALVGEKDELLAITYWAMAEGCIEGGQFAPYVETFQEVVSPILWPEEQRAQLLKGSSALAAARQKESAARAEWASMKDVFAAEPEKFPPEIFNETVFLRVLCCVLARSVYLPSAECYALIPVADFARRRCQAPEGTSLAILDYDLETQSVVLLASRNYSQGEEVVIADALQRNSAELLVDCGYIDEEGEGDYLEVEASLVAVDALFKAKKNILDAAGYSARGQTFPLFRDRLPTQLFSYLRLSRAQAVEDLARVQLDRDVPLSPLNEYEVVTLLLAEMRERLKAYPVGWGPDVPPTAAAGGGLRPGTGAEDLRAASAAGPAGLSRPEALAARLRLRERQVLEATLQALLVRRQAFNGVPTKGGKLQDPNADLHEVFDLMMNPVGKLVETVQYSLGWDKTTPKK